MDILFIALIFWCIFGVVLAVITIAAMDVGRISMQELPTGQKVLLGVGVGPTVWVASIIVFLCYQLWLLAGKWK